ncbi:MAG: phage tail protein [Defluviitaleaceae bacterium]|nr:phage tail protein [Defluviitaleaceae bacterium]MCL2261697.1 phage tail protein [Defluviitaleaceae bacterium]
MARFETILTSAGSAALTAAMYNGEKVFPDYVLAGSGILSGNPATVTALVNPVTVDIKINDRELIVSEDETVEPSLLKIATQVSNAGITAVTPIRELLLYANSQFDSGGNLVQLGIPFAYAWLNGADTDNILSPPINPGQQDTLHFHELAIFVTNQELASIEVRFALDGFVTHRMLNELMGKILQPSFDGETLTFTQGVTLDG